MKISLYYAHVNRGKALKAGSLYYVNKRCRTSSGALIFHVRNMQYLFTFCYGCLQFLVLVFKSEDKAEPE